MIAVVKGVDMDSNQSQSSILLYSFVFFHETICLPLYFLFTPIHPTSLFGLRQFPRLHLPFVGLGLARCRLFGIFVGGRWEIEYDCDVVPLLIGCIRGGTRSGCIRRSNKMESSRRYKRRMFLKNNEQSHYPLLSLYLWRHQVRKSSTGSFEWRHCSCCFVIGSKYWI